VLAAARIRGRLTIDGLSLAARYHRNHLRFAEQARRQIVASARAGESVQRVAERLLDQGSPIVRLPEHVEDLAAVARRAAAGDPEGRAAFDAAVNQWSGRIQRLGQGGRPGTYTVRSATQQLVRDLDGATTAQVDRAVDRWVLDRARHQARTIARHETAEAFRDSYREASASSPGVVGYRWTLSPRHSRPDVCGLLANQDLYGLGPGGYPVGAVPATPHTNCLCAATAIVDRAHMRRQLAQETGGEEPPRPWESGTRETATEWLHRQPRALQDKLLGPTRGRILRDPSDARDVVTQRGIPIPVHQVLGLPPPVRRDGPAVRARPIIRADRARGQVQPFPRAPRLPRADDGRRRR
jgi:hypothetical protein